MNNLCTNLMLVFNGKLIILLLTISVRFFSNFSLFIILISYNTNNNNHVLVLNLILQPEKLTFLVV